MLTFVAMEGDKAAATALRIIRETAWLTGCPTRTLTSQDGTAGPDDVVFFTGNAKSHWPSKWLRIPQNQRLQNPLPPEWAENARRVIAIRPRDDIEGQDGFAAAVRGVASNLTGLKQPLTVLRPQPERRSNRSYAPYDS